MVGRMFVFQNKLGYWSVTRPFLFCEGAQRQFKHFQRQIFYKKLFESSSIVTMHYEENAYIMCCVSYSLDSEGQRNKHSMIQYLFDGPEVSIKVKTHGNSKGDHSVFLQLLQQKSAYNS